MRPDGLIISLVLAPRDRPWRCKSGQIGGSQL